VILTKEFLARGAFAGLGKEGSFSCRYLPVPSTMTSYSFAISSIVAILQAGNADGRWWIDSAQTEGARVIA
jgi:hypothetical protein